MSSPSSSSLRPSCATQALDFPSSVEIQTEIHPPFTIENALPKQSLQPPSAHLDASYSPARPASRTPSEDEDGDLDSDLDEDIDGDLDSVSGTEDELERAPRRRRRPRVTEYRPRRRNHGPQFRAPNTPLDPDDSFRFSVPARQYNWAGSSMLYDSTDTAE
ncbi:hypothetical protein E4U33_005111 [Claviceps sp. LM78 group G4]|nr:hypothetical protein E4U33_005111 [Claviceps sp. LM78 group G4]